MDRHKKQRKVFLALNDNELASLDRAVHQMGITRQHLAELSIECIAELTVAGEVHLKPVKPLKFKEGQLTMVRLADEVDLLFRQQAKKKELSLSYLARLYVLHGLAACEEERGLQGPLEKEEFKRLVRAGFEKTQQVMPVHRRGLLYLIGILLGWARKR